MEFRKIVKIEEQGFYIGYENQILSLGSCFADHIGERLKQSKLKVCSNPFGVLYNPLSILSALQQIAAGAEIEADELVEHQGRYHSFSFHSAFSGDSIREALGQMNQAIREGGESYRKCDRLLITFGTAWVYELPETGTVVSNCHKLPARMFNRRRLTVQEVVSVWSEFLTAFVADHPEAKIVFTVSPIRHWKDGAFENQCSKATLLLAIEALCSQFACCSYFPSYEIFMDELRDYRFYADDMIHPSEQAIAYVWERFGGTFFAQQTKQDMVEWEKLRKMLQHRSLSGMSESYRNFLRENLRRIEQFTQKKPYFDLNLELEQLKELCSTL